MLPPTPEELPSLDFDLFITERRFFLFYEFNDEESTGSKLSTSVGSCLFSKSFKPNWPLKLRPQENTSPSLERA